MGSQQFSTSFFASYGGTVPGSGSLYGAAIPGEAVPGGILPGESTWGASLARSPRKSLAATMGTFSGTIARAITRTLSAVIQTFSASFNRFTSHLLPTAGWGSWFGSFQQSLISFLVYYVYFIATYGGGDSSGGEYGQAVLGEAIPGSPDGESEAVWGASLAKGTSRQFQAATVEWTAAIIKRVGLTFSATYSEWIGFLQKQIGKVLTGLYSIWSAIFSKGPGPLPITLVVLPIKNCQERGLFAVGASPVLLAVKRVSEVTLPLVEVFE